MTDTELDILLLEETRAAIEQNILRSPFDIALDKRLSFSSIVATQVKYLQRCASKLPSFYAARCLLSQRSYEQSSSEAVALSRSFTSRLGADSLGGAPQNGVFCGRLAIDLTCGLGVDAYGLSKNFERVVALERDPILARTARENFRRLGATNIDVIECRAEEFVAQTDLRADLIFADPDRRGERGEKLYKLEDCSPNIVALAPKILTLAPIVAVKCSPIFDVEAPRQIFEAPIRCSVVSLKGENKEILLEFGNAINRSSRCAMVVGEGEIEFMEPIAEPANPQIDPKAAQYLVVPDVALQKGRLATSYLRPMGIYIDNDNAFGFSETICDTKFARFLAIDQIVDYAPKNIARDLKKQSQKHVNLMIRNFPISAQVIAKELKINEGGSRSIAFTMLQGKRKTIFLQLQ